MGLQLARFPVELVRGHRYPSIPGPRGRTCPTDKVWYGDDFLDERASGHLHEAVDIFAPLGARVVAARGGRVLETWKYQGEIRPGAGWSEIGGWYVRIAADDGGTDYYAHLASAPFVGPGARVRAGELIGLVGNTGNAATTCPHLHYGVRDAQGRAVSPHAALDRLLERDGVLVSPGMPAWAWLAGAGALGALGWVLWSRRRR